MAWYGTFLTKHQTHPPPPHRPRRECDHSIPRIGFDGLVSVPFRPTISMGSFPFPSDLHYHPLPSTDETLTAHPARRASTWVGSTFPPACSIHDHSFTADTFGDFRHHGLPSSRVVFFMCFVFFFPLGERFYSSTECSTASEHQTGSFPIPNPIPIPEGTSMTPL